MINEIKYEDYESSANTVTGTVNAINRLVNTFGVKLSEIEVIQTMGSVSMSETAEEYLQNN